MSWFLKALGQYATFSGRARRKEYWYFVLFQILIAIVLSFVDVFMGLMSEHGWGLLSSIFWLALLLPSIAVGVRRLHDTGRSGWWLLLVFIPLVGALVVLFFTVQDSEPETNQYGPNPKAA